MGSPAVTITPDQAAGGGVTITPDAPSESPSLLSRMANQPTQFSRANPLRYFDELGQNMAKGVQQLEHPIDTAGKMYDYLSNPPSGHDPSGDKPLLEGLGDVADTSVAAWGQMAPAAVAGKAGGALIDKASDIPLGAKAKALGKVGMQEAVSRIPVAGRLVRRPSLMDYVNAARAKAPTPEPVEPDAVYSPGYRTPRAYYAGQPPEAIPQRSGLQLTGEVAPPAKLAEQIKTGSDVTPALKSKTPDYYATDEKAWQRYPQAGSEQDLAETRDIQAQVREQAGREQYGRMARANEEGYARNTRPRTPKGELIKRVQGAESGTQTRQRIQGAVTPMEAKATGRPLVDTPEYYEANGRPDLAAQVQGRSRFAEPEEVDNFMRKIRPGRDVVRPEAVQRAQELKAAAESVAQTKYHPAAQDFLNWRHALTDAERKLVPDLFAKPPKPGGRLADKVRQAPGSSTSGDLTEEWDRNNEYLKAQKAKNAKK